MKKIGIIVLVFCSIFARGQQDTLDLQEISWLPEAEVKGAISFSLMPEQDLSTFRNRKANYYKLSLQVLRAFYENGANQKYEEANYHLVDTPMIQLRRMINQQLAIAVDQNVDGDFEDEILYPAALNKEIRVPVVFNWKEKKTGASYQSSYHYALRVVWKEELENYLIEIKGTGNAYRLKERLPGGMQAHIIPSIFFPPILLYDSLGNTIRGNQDANRGFSLFEPFQIGSSWYYLGPLDEAKKEIYLTKLDPNEKPYGFAEGYYMDLALLEKNTTQVLFEQWDTLRQPYALLHFWGPWCGHCMHEKEEVLELASRLESSSIHLVNIAFLFPNAKQTESMQRQMVKQLIEEGEVPRQQNYARVIEYGYHPGGFNPFRFSKHIGYQLDCTRYPAYFLIHKTGEILLRHNGRMKEKLLPKLETYLVD